MANVGFMSPSIMALLLNSYVIFAANFADAIKNIISFLPLPFYSSDFGIGNLISLIVILFISLTILLSLLFLHTSLTSFTLYSPFLPPSLTHYPPSFLTLTPTPTPHPHPHPLSILSILSFLIFEGKPTVSPQTPSLLKEITIIYLSLLFSMVPFFLLNILLFVFNWYKIELYNRDHLLL